MAEARMVKTLKAVKSAVWGYVVYDLPKRRSHFQFDIEF